jgi:hypothetical protein
MELRNYLRSSQFNWSTIDYLIMWYWSNKRQIAGDQVIRKNCFENSMFRRHLVN